MPNWSPDLYLKFNAERTQPAADLVARISLDNPRRIIDLGCGPGNSTSLLRDRWPDAEVAGLDNSVEMLEKAARDWPEGAWIEGDIGSWRAEEAYDLVFTNAALQWVPDHETLLPQLLDQVRDGGALAVQMPAQFDSAIHRLIAGVATREAWRDATETALRSVYVGNPSFYYDLLMPRSRRLELWLTEYIHIMPGARGILDWVRATALRNLLDALKNDEQRMQFEAEVLEQIADDYPPQGDGRVLFPFRRIFFIAYR